VRRRRAASKRPASIARPHSDDRGPRGVPPRVHAELVELLRQTRFDSWQIGGSHAQRDFVNWTPTEAAVRVGQRDVALSLAPERLATRSRIAPKPSLRSPCRGHRGVIARSALFITSVSGLNQ
jgi:hypothetical protein